MNIGATSQAFTPVAVAAKTRPSPTQSAAQNTASQPIDSFHISATGKNKSRPTAQIRFAETNSAKQDFGSAVHVDKPRSEDKKFLGMVHLTSSQEQQIKVVEAKAFQRFENPGNDAQRGSIYAKVQQSKTSHYQPGYLELNASSLSVSESEQKQVMKALQDYGEDLAAIAVSGRDMKGLQRHVEDRAFIKLFDRDKEEFEDYFKAGFQDFWGDRTAENNPANPLERHDDPPQTPVNGKDPREEYKWRFLKPQLGIGIQGLDFKNVKLKPKVDLVKLTGPALTEVRVIANVPFTFNGQIEPEAEIKARRILNHKPGEYGGLKDNVFIEANSVYNYSEGNIRSSVGVRKQISPDASMGAYALYSLSINGKNADDMGIGVNYQARFD